jgi:putative FmdB family regulatory protein
VPTYEYQCDQCRRTFEVQQRITAAPLTRCDVCGGSVRRLLAPAPFILKGEGWYVTDYPSEARKKAIEAEKSSSEKKTDKAAASAEKSSTSTSETSASAASAATAAPSATASASGASTPSSA